MRSYLQIITILCFLADAAGELEWSRVAATVDDEGRSFLDSFQTAWRKRVELDGRSKFVDVSIEKIIGRYNKYLARKGDVETSPHGRVEFFCRDHRKGGCNYQQAYILLLHDFKHNPRWSKSRSFAEQWQRPSELLEQAYPRPGQKECDVLERAPSSREFYEHYVSKGKPVIIRGGVAGWPAVGKRQWDISYLVDRVGDETVKVFISPTTDFEAPMTMGDYRSLLRRVVTDGEDHRDIDASIADDVSVLMRPAETEFTFREYAYLTLNYSNAEKATFYLQKHPMIKWKEAGLLKDLMPSLFEDSKPRRKKLNSRRKRDGKSKNNGGWARFLALEHWLLWMGKNFSRGNLHYDPNENLHAVVKGSKTFNLFHPFSAGMYEDMEFRFRSSHFLYDWSKSTDSGQFWALPVSITPEVYQPFSPVNTTYPDNKKYPLYNDNGTCCIFVYLSYTPNLLFHVEKLVCTVDAGDVIYIPSNWYCRAL